MTHPVQTGVPEVDAVLADLDGLDDRPVSDHVAVFESAHQSLRRALDAQPDEVGPAGPDLAPGDPGDPA